MTATPTVTWMADPADPTRAFVTVARYPDVLRHHPSFLEAIVYWRRRDEVTLNAVLRAETRWMLDQAPGRGDELLVEVVVEVDRAVYPDTDDTALTVERAVRALFDDLPGVTMRSVHTGRLS